MHIVVDLVVLLVSMAGLWFGAGWLVEAAARIARRLGVSELVIGLTVVAFGTSAPELAVTIGAALTGRDDVSLANVIGSNLFNTGIILGGSALAAAMRIDPKLVHRDGLLLLGVMLSLLLFARDGRLERPEGLLWIGLLVAYLVVLIVGRGEAPLDEAPEGEYRATDPLLLLAGLAVVVGGGRFLVESATDLARLVGLSEWLIGLTVVAAGTSLPEVATSLVAALKGKGAISAGAVIGSNLFNLLGVLGVAATIRPLAVGPSLGRSLGLLFAVTVVALVMMWTGRRLSRREGAVLFAFAVAAWLVEAFA